MATHDSTGTARGSTRPIVAELIRDEIANWFGQQHPYPDVKESISAEALEGMLNRVADRAFTAGSTGAVSPELADKLYSAPVHLDALSAAISLLAGCAQSDALSDEHFGALDTLLGATLADLKETVLAARSALTRE